MEPRNLIGWIFHTLKLYWLRFLRFKTLSERFFPLAKSDWLIAMEPWNLIGQFWTHPFSQSSIFWRFLKISFWLIDFLRKMFFWPRGHVPMNQEVPLTRKYSVIIHWTNICCQQRDSDIFHWNVLLTFDPAPTNAFYVVWPSFSRGNIAKFFISNKENIYHHWASTSSSS